MDRVKLAGVGIWSGELRYGDEGEIRDAAAELDDLGYSALWIPDAGGDVFRALETLLEPTSAIVAATGILNLWMHSVDNVGRGFAALEADHPGRTLIGIGVSNPIFIDQTHPGQYKNPLQIIRQYLDDLDAVSPTVPRHRRVLAALGPKMLELARDRAGGAHPYLMTPEHTQVARVLHSATARCSRPSSTWCSRPTPRAPAPLPVRASRCTCSSPTRTT